MQKVAYLFPGQGAQYVGMGKDFYENCADARDIFNEAEEILPDLGIKRLCFEGPIEELTQTANSQVCILVTSIAAHKALSSWLLAHGKGFEVVACAGLSLGELTALVSAGSINFQDAVQLVRRRGELMEEASIKNPGTMASVIGFSLKGLREVCAVSGAEIANLNCPGQIVISGTKESVQKTITISMERGAKRAIPLNVSGGFHSSLMEGASRLLRIELDKVQFSVSEIGIVSNATAGYEKIPEEIKENLVKQLYSPVRWEESVREIVAQGVDTFFEIGPGKVLKGLLRRIDSKLKVYNIEKMEDLDNLDVS